MSIEDLSTGHIDRAQLARCRHHLFRFRGAWISYFWRISSNFILGLANEKVCLGLSFGTRRVPTAI